MRGEELDKWTLDTPRAMGHDFGFVLQSIASSWGKEQNSGLRNGLQCAQNVTNMITGHENCLHKLTLW